MTVHRMSKIINFYVECAVQSSRRAKSGIVILPQGLLKFIIFALVLTSQLFITSLQAADIKAMRSWHSPEGSRLVFDVNKPVAYKVFTLSNPARVVVDIKNSRFLAKIPSPKSEFSVIRYIRTGQYDKSTYRIVIEISESVKANAFQLAPNSQYGQRLVVDLNRLKPKSDPQITASKKQQTIQPAAPKKKPDIPGKQKLVVAVDAGHGGEDPGALGKRGTREKDVVLAIAKKVASRINKHPQMQAVMIRKGDYYVGLEKRTRIARDYGADLFVSIHADAVKRRNVRGSSIYALSDKRATSEIAKWLAAKENASDLAGGVSIADKDDDVAGVIMDLMMDNTKHESIIFAKDVLHEMKQVGPVLHNTIERASFAVLKSPDIPSILIETAFISNPKDEKKLKNKKFQNRIADAIFNGINRYANRTAFKTLARN